MIKSPTPVDKRQFAEDLKGPEALYGLPQEIAFCKPKNPQSL